MFFNSKRYKQEAEKNIDKKELEQEPSMFNMISLALLASFPPTRIFLKMHRRKITDYSTVEKTSIIQEPVIYIHGFRGGDYTTRIMVKKACEDKGTSKFLKVTVDLLGNFKFEGTWTGDKHPIVQLVFRQKIAGINCINYYLKFTLPFLAKRFNFKHYNAVAHSLGAPCIIWTQMRYAKNKKFPQLKKCALIAGPFDGVMYLGDIPNINYLTEKGRPALMSWHYISLLLYRKRMDPNVRILNIYGNVLDETNTDRFISVVSAKSIRYIISPTVRFYREVEIRGKNAEHSRMHDDPFVINLLSHFLQLNKRRHQADL